MEVNALAVTKLEANRQRPPPPKEIALTSESPPDVGRLLVPLEDLDRVDGIRASSSRTRAVALLPAIEESVEEGPESLQLEEPGAQNKHGGRRTSSKPMLTSISEERIPRLWEYPIGGCRRRDQARSQRQVLGAGEAPPIQPQREQGSPATFDKTSDGDAGLVEAGDSEAGEGNRSNHALEEPGSCPEEKDGVGGTQNILLTASSTTETNEKAGDPRSENHEGACALENSAPSHTSVFGSSGHVDLEQFGREAVIGFGACLEASLLKLGDEKGKMQSEPELIEVGLRAHFSDVVKEKTELVPSGGNIFTGNEEVGLFKANSDTELLEESCVDKQERLEDPLQLGVTGRRGGSRDLTFINGNERDVLWYRFKRENLHIDNSEMPNRLIEGGPPTDNVYEERGLDSLKGFLCEEEVSLLKCSTIHQRAELRDGIDALSGDSSVDKTNMETKIVDPSNQVKIMNSEKGFAAFGENVCLSASDDLVSGTIVVGKERINIELEKIWYAPEEFKSEYVKDDVEIETNTARSPEDQVMGVDLIPDTKEKFQEVLQLTECIDDANTENSLNGMINEHNGAMALKEEKDESKIMSSTEQIGNYQTLIVLDRSRNVDEMSDQVNSKENGPASQCFCLNMDRSVQKAYPVMSAEAVADIGKTKATNRVQIAVSKDHHDQGPDKYQGGSFIEESIYNVRGDNDNDIHVIDDEECYMEEKQVGTEVIVKEISSQEDSIVSSTGSSRAKGSGSDSMVAEGTVSVADGAGARESHSDHTSCSDKVDQTVKAKDGSAKPRGRERERTKRKRADREEREERGGSTGGKQKSLKNAIGDVQAETEDVEEAVAEDTVQVKVKNSPAHDLVGRESRTIRAASSGDVRDDAVKSTCGLESQTVTSLDDPPSEMLESAGLWEQEQIWEDSDNSGRSHTPPKGIPASRFGKRTQLHRQKQGSPQEQVSAFPDTEKSNLQIRTFGLGDSEVESFVKTRAAEFSLADNSAWVARSSGPTTGQDESCNNPMESITTIDSANNHLQHEVEVPDSDDTPLVHSESQHVSQTEEQALRNFEHEILELGSNQICASILTETIGNIRSRSRDVFNFHGVDTHIECTDEHMHLGIPSSSEVNPVKLVDEKALGLHNSTADWKKPGQAEVNIITGSQIDTLSQGINDLGDTVSENRTPSLDSKKLNLSFDFAEDNSECRADDGSICCRQAGPRDRRSSLTTISTMSPTTDGLSDASPYSSLSGTSVASSKTDATSKTGASSKSGRKCSSNFDSLFPPTMCRGSMCFKIPEKPKPNVDDDLSVSSKLQSISASEDDKHLILPHESNVPGDISENSDSFNTIPARESSAQTLIVSEELLSSNHHVFVPIHDQHEERFDSALYKRLEADAPEDFQLTVTLKNREMAVGSNQSQFSKKPYSLDQMKDSQKEESWGDELISYPPEGLHVSHIDSHADNFETALVSALAEAAQDCSPPVARNNPSREHLLPSTVATPSIEHSGQNNIETDPLKETEKYEEIYSDENSLTRQLTSMMLNKDSSTIPNPQIDSQKGFGGPYIETEANSAGCVSESGPLKHSGGLLKVSIASNVDSALPAMACNENAEKSDTASQLHKINQPRYEEGRNLCGISQVSNFSSTGSEACLQHICLHEESHETALFDPAQIPMSEVAEEGSQDQVPNHEVSLDQGDFPVADKMQEDTEVSHKYDNIFLEGQEIRPIIDHEVMAAFQNTFLTSPFLQNRPHTPVAGDGDWGEKDESETSVKPDPTGFAGALEEEKPRDTQLSTHLGEIVKSTILKQKEKADDDFFEMDEVNARLKTVETGRNDLEIPYDRTVDIAEDTKDYSPFFQQGASTTVEDSERDAHESKKPIEDDLSIPSETSAFDLGIKDSGAEKLPQTAGLAVEESEIEINEIDLGETDVKDIIGAAEEASEAGNRENKKSSEQSNTQSNERVEIWADMVIREADRVCDDYQQKLHGDEVGEYSTSPILPDYKGEHPTLEELAMFPESAVSHHYGQNEATTKGGLKKSTESEVEIVGRSKDGGKRAKRSKPYGKQESEMSGGQRLASDGRVKRITVVDVAFFPKDAPCVYHPDREDGVNRRERVFSHSQIARSGNASGKTSTLWRRFKTIFHPRRLMSKERKAKPEQQRSGGEYPAREASAVTPLPAPIIHLRQSAKSDDTLGQPIRHPLAESSEAWSGARHKVKVRPPGQWHRLKKFRALRHGAERRRGRLPATMRQVVSKSNYVREAEGDQLSNGRHGASRSSHRKGKLFSADMPLLDQPRHLLEKNQRTSRSTPEVTQVFREDEDLADEHLSPDQPTVRLLLKPAPVVSPSLGCDESPIYHTGGGKELCQYSHSYQEKNSLLHRNNEFKSSRAAFQNGGTGESGKVLEVSHKEKPKANTYHGNEQDQTCMSHAKDKANTYQSKGKYRPLQYSTKGTSNEGPRTNKNCRLM